MSNRKCCSNLVTRAPMKRMSRTQSLEETSLLGGHRNENGFIFGLTSGDGMIYSVC
jgi:hypothetical protein